MSIQDTAGKIPPNLWDQGDYKTVEANLYSSQGIVPSSEKGYVTCKEYTTYSNSDHTRLSTFILNAERSGTIRYNEPHWINEENVGIIDYNIKKGAWLDNRFQRSRAITLKNQMIIQYNGPFSPKFPQV